MPSAQTQFKEGNPGGPGRPKGVRNIKTVVREILAAVPVDQSLADGMDFEGRLNLQELVLLSLAKKALEGDTKAAQLLFAHVGNPGSAFDDIEDRFG